MMNPKFETKIKKYEEETNKYILLGLSEPICICVFENDEFMVLKFPPHKSWIARGQYKNIPTQYGIYWKHREEVEFNK